MRKTLTLTGSIWPVSDGAGTSVKRSSWPDLRSLAAKIGDSASMMSFASEGSVPALVNRLCSVSPRPTIKRLALGAGEHLVVEFVLIVVGGVIGGFLDHRHVRRGGEAESVFGMIGRLQKLRAAVADRAGHVGRAVGVGEILGRLGDQLIDLVLA